MFKGPVGPQSGRTSRTQAEKLGTESSGFEGAPEYFPQGGYPPSKDLPKQEYKEREIKPAQQGSPVSNKTPPFSIGGGS